MASIPQTSHDYLLLQLPQVAQLADASEEETNQSPQSSDWDRREDHKTAWAKRLKQMRLKTEELQALAGEDATTHLMLGVFHGFSYGFENLHLSQWRHERIYTADGGFFDSLDRATFHFQEALRLLEKEPEPNGKAILFAKYLLGKHAVNAASGYSHPGSYTFSGEKIPPEPQAYVYLDLAETMLTDAQKLLNDSTDRRNLLPTHSLADETTGGNGFQELTFEVRYFLLELKAMRVNFKNHRYHKNKDPEQIALVEALLIDALIGSPREWVDREMHSNPYCLLDRLIGDLRWFYQDRRYVGDQARRDALFEFVANLGHPSAPTYDYLIRTLIDKLGYDRLRVLL